MSPKTSERFKAVGMDLFCKGTIVFVSYLAVITLVMYFAHIDIDVPNNLLFPDKKPYYQQSANITNVLDLLPSVKPAGGEIEQEEDFANVDINGTINLNWFGNTTVIIQNLTLYSYNETLGLGTNEESNITMFYDEPMDKASVKLKPHDSDNDKDDKDDDKKDKDDN